jgi:hypothetical protein
VAVGDVSGDGQPDLIAVRSNYEDGFVVVFVNDGAGSFRRDGVNTLKNDEASRVAAGDFNGDGISDVVVDGLQGAFSILLATGDGRLAAPRTVPGRGGRDLTVGDFNADGRLDVALAASSARSITVRLGNGDGSFGPARAFGVARDDAMTVSTADLNNDAKLDLVVTPDLGTFGALHGNNDGTFGAQTNYRMGEETGIALVGDFKAIRPRTSRLRGAWGTPARCAWARATERLGSGTRCRCSRSSPTPSRNTREPELSPTSTAMAAWTSPSSPTTRSATALN